MKLWSALAPSTRKRKIREGWTATTWHQWTRLKPATRRKLDSGLYRQGVKTVGSQRKAQAERLGKASLSTRTVTPEQHIEHGLAILPGPPLRMVLTRGAPFLPTDRLIGLDEWRREAIEPPTLRDAQGEFNPYWYHSFT